MVTKVPRQNKVNAHSSKAERDSEITMPPTLYRCTTQIWQYTLSACGLNNMSLLSIIVVDRRTPEGAFRLSIGSNSKN